MRPTNRPGTTSPSGLVSGIFSYMVHGASVPQCSDPCRLWSFRSLVLGIHSRLICSPLELTASRVGSGLSPDDSGHGRTAPTTDGGDSEFATRALEGIVQRRDDAGPGAAGGMSKRDRSAMDVELVAIPVEHPFVRQDLGGESLVDLDEVHVRERHARASQGFGDGYSGPLAHEPAVDRRLRILDHREQRLTTALLRFLSAHGHQGAGTVGEAARVAGGHLAVASESRLELGHGGCIGVVPYGFIFVEDHLGLPALGGDRHRGYLFVEPSVA